MIARTFYFDRSLLDDQELVHDFDRSLIGARQHVPVRGNKSRDSDLSRSLKENLYRSLRRQPISPVNHRQYFLFDEIDSVKYPRFECSRHTHGYVHLFIDINNIAAVTNRRINLPVIKRLIP